MKVNGAVHELEPIKLAPTPEEADLAISGLTRFISEIYLPFRGAPGYKTERAILPAPPHTPHRENDAEHSWSIEKAVQLLHSRPEYGLVFNEDFNIYKARAYASTHDVVEIVAEDVSALTLNLEDILRKPEREAAALEYMRKNMSYFKSILDEWEEYEEKDNPESQYVSDVDKIVSTLVICVDKGRRWLGEWEGEHTPRDFVVGRQRSKIITPNGFALHDALERKLDEHPEYFPAHMQIQGELFDASPYKVKTTV